ncbi:MAG: TAXI family TRAP transporter solute-binding subunit, partial [Micromonosporaceae bacterium]
PDRRSPTVLAAVVLVGAARAACSGSAEPEPQPPERTIDRIAIASGPTSGVFHPVGTAMAEILDGRVAGLPATARATTTPAESVRLVGSGDSEIAIASADVVHQAVRGEGEFSGPTDLRVLMLLHPEVYHAVTLRAINEDLELDCLTDVRGTRFSVGASGSAEETSTGLVFDALGMSFDDVQAQRSGPEDTAAALREGSVDAGAWMVPEGDGTLRDLEETDPIHLIHLCSAELTQVTEAYPWYAPHVIRAGTYDTVEQDTPTVALWHLVVVRSDFPEEVAYEITKALYGGVEQITEVYELGEPYLVADTLARSPLPLHPGAVRYAEEAGVEVRDELRG